MLFKDHGVNHLWILGLNTIVYIMSTIIKIVKVQVLALKTICIYYVVYFHIKFQYYYIIYTFLISI